VSQEIVKTELEGFIGPIEHSLLDALNNAWEDDEGRTLGGAICLLEKLPHRNRFLKSLQTDDGYKWFLGISFTIGNGDLTVLFPWGLDAERKDSSRMDRSVGIYIKGDVDDDALNTVLLQIIKVLEGPSK